MQHAGRFDEAEARYQEALTANPANAVALNNLGALARSRDALDEAEACYRRAIALQPGQIAFRANLVLADAEQGRWVEAARGVLAASALAHARQALPALGAALRQAGVERGVRQGLHGLVPGAGRGPDAIGQVLFALGWGPRPTPPAGAPPGAPPALLAEPSRSPPGVSTGAPPGAAAAGPPKSAPPAAAPSCPSAKAGGAGAGGVRLDAEAVAEFMWRHGVELSAAAEAVLRWGACGPEEAALGPLHEPAPAGRAGGGRRRGAEAQAGTGGARAIVLLRLRQQFEENGWL